MIGPDREATRSRIRSPHTWDSSYDIGARGQAKLVRALSSALGIPICEPMSAAPGRSQSLAELVPQPTHVIKLNTGWEGIHLGHRKHASQCRYVELLGIVWSKGRGVCSQGACKTR